MIIPVMNICFVFMRPVEYAIALGGVLIGNDIANDAAMATPTSSVPTPPKSPNASFMPVPTATMIGTINAVQKYAGFNSPQTVYDQNSVFIFKFLDSMAEEAKQIEDMNRKMKTK